MTLYNTSSWWLACSWIISKLLWWVVTPHIQCSAFCYWGWLIISCWDIHSIFKIITLWIHYSYIAVCWIRYTVTKLTACSKTCTVNKSVIDKYNCVFTTHICFSYILKICIDNASGKCSIIITSVYCLRRNCLMICAIYLWIWYIILFSVIYC